jgi:hypothetical protein
VVLATQLRSLVDGFADLDVDPVGGVPPRR